LIHACVELLVVELLATSAYPQSVPPLLEVLVCEVALKHDLIPLPPAFSRGRQVALFFLRRLAYSHEPLTGLMYHMWSRMRQLRLAIHMRLASSELASSKLPGAKMSGR